MCMCICVCAYYVCVWFLCVYMCEKFLECVPVCLWCVCVHVRIYAPIPNFVKVTLHGDGTLNKNRLLHTLVNQ